ncbi:hypothetical protein BS47DRAFT_788758 [Hydnum rufescens UP504]|uniref:Uncharacterized protein n=1 Tax=Hydnum rufescens UP504 TaxID=1448309 RepID=A0A9P6DMI7_9AGAM|nr:hypothetical protein BS47DRAFT_788758 [Hydnum rufescens UP504]
MNGRRLGRPSRPKELQTRRIPWRIRLRRPPIPYYHLRLILTRLCRPSFFITISVSQSSLSSFASCICTSMPFLCVLRCILRPEILLHLVRMAHSPEVPLISLTYGIHSRLFCPSHSRLSVFLVWWSLFCNSRHPARSADSWAGAAISRTSSHVHLTDDHSPSESQCMLQYASGRCCPGLACNRCWHLRRGEVGCRQCLSPHRRLRKGEVSKQCR